MCGRQRFAAVSGRFRKEGQPNSSRVGTKETGLSEESVFWEMVLPRQEILGYIRAFAEICPNFLRTEMKGQFGSSESRAADPNKQWSSLPR